MEYELRFLAKDLPSDLNSHKYEEITDLYIPNSTEYPRMRIRQVGSKLELTKKVTIDDNLSTQEELTIPLNQDEFNALASLPNKKVHKIRYYYPVGKYIAEINVYLEDLAGLVTVEFEFPSKTTMENFKDLPDFCGADVSNEKFISGGKLAGKSYGDIEGDLLKFDYQKITN